MSTLSRGLEDGLTPKHLQLRDRIVELVAGLPADAPIPSERALMRQFEVSRGTVRKAVEALIDDGVLARAQGRGTYVASAASSQRLLTPVYLASFTRDMTSRGLHPDTQVLELSKGQPPPEARNFFGVAACWRLLRLRRADAEPMAYEETYLRADLLPEFAAVYDGGSVYELLASRYDVPVDSAEQIVWAEVADQKLAHLLDIGPGTPLMVFQRRSTSRGRPVEFVTSWYRGDRYSVQMSLHAT